VWLFKLRLFNSKSIGDPRNFSDFVSFTLLNKGWEMASYSVILKNGLNTRVLVRKSIASSDAPGYFIERSAGWILLNPSRYSKALVSVTNDISSFDGDPITANITASWSVEENGKPCFYSVTCLAGESGKHDFPGNNGFLSINVGEFSFIIPRSSAKIHPIDHISIAGP